METERAKRQSNMGSHRTRGEQHTASARSARNSFPMHAFFFFAQGPRSRLKVTALCHHFICTLSGRFALHLHDMYVLRCLYTRYHKKQHKIVKVHILHCALRKSGGLSGRLAIQSPLTQGAQEGLRLAKKPHF